MRKDSQASAAVFRGRGVYLWDSPHDVGRWHDWLLPTRLTCTHRHCPWRTAPVRPAVCDQGGLAGCRDVSVDPMTLGEVSVCSARTGCTDGLAACAKRLSADWGP